MPAGPPGSPLRAAARACSTQDAQPRGCGLLEVRARLALLEPLSFRLCGAADVHDGAQRPRALRRPQLLWLQMVVTSARACPEDPRHPGKARHPDRLLDSSVFHQHPPPVAQATWDSPWPEGGWSPSEESASRSAPLWRRVSCPGAEQARPWPAGTVAPGLSVRGCSEAQPSSELGHLRGSLHHSLEPRSGRWSEAGGGVTGCLGGQWGQVLGPSPPPGQRG